MKKIIFVLGLSLVLGAGCKDSGNDEITHFDGTAKLIELPQFPENSLLLQKLHRMDEIRKVYEEVSKHLAEVTRVHVKHAGSLTAEHHCLAGYLTVESDQPQNRIYCNKESSWDLRRESHTFGPGTYEMSIDPRSAQVGEVLAAEIRNLDQSEYVEFSYKVAEGNSDINPAKFEVRVSNMTMGQEPQVSLDVLNGGKRLTFSFVNGILSHLENSGWFYNPDADVESDEEFRYTYAFFHCGTELTAVQTSPHSAIKALADGRVISRTETWEEAEGRVYFHRVIDQMSGGEPVVVSENKVQANGYEIVRPGFSPGFLEGLCSNQ